MSIEELVRPVLWAVEDLRGRRQALQVSAESTVANLLWDDGADRRLIRGLRERLGVPVEYTDTLVQVAARCLSR